MDPFEIREERVVTGSGPATAAPAPAPPAPTAAPDAAPPAVATTSVYTRRTGIYPAGYRSIQLVWLVVAVVDVVIALDFVFRAAGGHNTGFAHVIYRVAGWLDAPFDGIFNNTLANPSSTLRWSDVLAVAVYTVAAWIVTRLVRIAATPRSGAGSIS